MRSGRPFKPWDERPRIRPHLEWVWEAFWRLSTCRPLGMTVGPIPWTAVDRWARLNRVRARERFEYLIERMDAEFMKATTRGATKQKPKDDARG